MISERLPRLYTDLVDMGPESARWDVRGGARFHPARTGRRDT